MTKLDQLWEDAYKTAHVAADITEKAHQGKVWDHEWLAQAARELNCLAIAIKNANRGVRMEGES